MSARLKRVPDDDLPGTPHGPACLCHDCFPRNIRRLEFLFSVTRKVYRAPEHMPAKLKNGVCDNSWRIIEVTKELTQKYILQHDKLLCLKSLFGDARAAFAYAMERKVEKLLGGKKKKDVDDDPEAISREDLENGPAENDPESGWVDPYAPKSGSYARESGRLNAADPRKRQEDSQ